MKKQNKSRSALSLRDMTDIKNEKIELPVFIPRTILRKNRPTK